VNSASAGPDRTSLDLAGDDWKKMLKKVTDGKIEV